MSENPGDYGLVMPFIVCASHGGLLDDEAFVVGYELGALDAELAALAAHGHLLNRPLPIPRYLHSVGVAQADLIAMRHGYALTTEAWDGGAEWSRASFTIPGTAPED